jgi:hypothetical protein
MELGKEQKLEQLEKVLHSRTLQNSESLKAFLRYVVVKTVDDHEVLLKEYTIATEVFGRNADYDPRIDSVVRVQAGRLRTKLQEYYATEGKSDQIVIDLPKGHYHPVFNYVPNEAVQDPTHASFPPDSSINGQAGAVALESPSVSDRADRRRETVVRFILIGVIVALALALLTLYTRTRETQPKTLAAPAAFTADELRAVWGVFLDDPEPPLLLLSNPAVFRFVNKADPNVALENALELTPQQVRVTTGAPGFSAQQLPIDSQRPKLVLSPGMYTGMGEAIGLSRLATMFKEANKDILLRQSRLANPAEIKYRNVILLGSIYVNEWSRKLPSTENFSYTTSATIANREPQNGEETEYKPGFDEGTGELRTDYALITVKPNVSGDHAVMTLAGIYSEGTEGAAEFITTRTHLAILSQALRRVGGDRPPKYYQALLRVGVVNGTPTTITLVALRPIT